MKESKHAEEQVAFALRQAETGTRVEEICRKFGISQAAFYNWKKKFGGLGVSELRRLKPAASVPPQYPFHPNRTASSALGLRIMGRNDRSHFLPRNNGLHLCQELLFAGALVKLLQTAVNKTRLAHSECTLISRFIRKRIIAEYRN